MHLRMTDEQNIREQEARLEELRTLIEVNEDALEKTRRTLAEMDTSIFTKSSFDFSGGNGSFGAAI